MREYLFTLIKGARTVLFYHDNSISKALIDLFPNIGLDKAKLVKKKSMLMKITILLTDVVSSIVAQSWKPKKVFWIVCQE